MSSPPRRTRSQSPAVLAPPSPTRGRGIIVLPVKTPNGRAGLRLPDRRSDTDLDRLARRRAWRTYEESDDELDDEDQRLADRIIRESKYSLGEDDEFETDDDDFEEELEPKRRRTRTALPALSAGLPKRKVGRPRIHEVRERRSRVGRPSKRDNVVNKVKSIFQMDDETLLAPVKREATPEPQKVQIEVNFDNSNMLAAPVPIISGVPETANDKREVETKFEPMPIPRMDDTGRIDDPEYVAKYFPDVNLEDKYTTKLTDGRAFFLEGAEGYFEQHSARVKTSANSLLQLAPRLEYPEFREFVDLGRLIQKQPRDKLAAVHELMFPQWCFELSQGFNLNLFGVGSKILVVENFCSYVVEWLETVYASDIPPVFVINGYNPATKLKLVMHDLARQVVGHKVSKHASESVPLFIEYLQETRSDPVRPKLILAIHNIDGESLRDEKTQNLVSQLAALPEVWLVASSDNINVSLLWDSFRIKNYNFIWHDATTYAPYLVELSFKDVLSMGKSKKFVGNKGAKYVLSSLTTNARNLYKILLTRQLEQMDRHAATRHGRVGLRGNLKLAITFKSFYTECLEQFVTSNEISFRILLGEFVEHKMCTLTKDESGTEMVFVPFSWDEIDQLLREELASN